MKNKNAGFSLLEVIVALAMITILAGVGAYGIGQLTGFRARETADQITSSLAQNKIETLGKAKSSGSMAWELVKDGKALYVRTVYDAGTGSESYGNVEEVDSSNLKVYVGEKTTSPSGSTTTVVALLGDGESMRVYFNRSTGALCDASGNPIDYNPVIRVKHGVKEYEVEVISKTGKVISNSRK